MFRISPTDTRDPDKVLEDVRNDYVSIERAHEDYGVVIDAKIMTINGEATRMIREGK